MGKNLEEARLSNLVKKTERNLFLANKNLKSFEEILEKTASVFQNIALIEETSEKTPALSKSLGVQMRERKFVGQSRELFKALEKARKDLDSLIVLEDRAKFFVERFRTTRMYSFSTSAGAIKFAKQLMELFSIESMLFRPRFIGPLDLNELSENLKLKKSGDGLLLQAKNLKQLVTVLNSKKLASNISLESDGLKLVWHDRKTIAVDSSSERLYRLDRLCDVLQGQCLEK